MPTPSRPTLSEPLTVLVPVRIKTALQKIADRRLAPLSQVLREAILDAVEREHAQEKSRPK